MIGNKKSLTEQMRLSKGEADGRGQRGQSKDTQPTGKLQDFEQYRRAVRRLFVEAYVMSLDFPRRLRFSWRVDRNGCLRCLTADEGGAR